MSKLDRFVDNRILQNGVVWAFLALIFSMLIQAENRLFSALVFIAFIIPPIYINNLMILPLYLKGKRVVATALFLCNIGFFTGLGVFLLSRFMGGFEWKMVYNVWGGILLSILFGTALKIARDSFFRRQQEKEAELKLLKAQLNPHFLFNTLNNLYGLSVVKSDRLPSLMLKLSDLLRYSLYVTKDTLVPLEKELKYLENYMSLEKIRLEDQAEISFSKTGMVGTKKIAPMLFIVFVENAFKHLAQSKDHKSMVEVAIAAEGDRISFRCTNTLEPTYSNDNDMEKGRSGIGLENVKKRLMLMYPDTHQLEIRKTPSRYTVQLKLTL